MPRRSESELQKVLTEASYDPDILVRNVTDTMRKYQISHASAKRAQHKALRRQVEDGGREAVAKINKRRLLRSLERVLANMRDKHPGLIRALITTRNLERTGKRFRLSRQRCKQLQDSIMEYSKLSGKPLQAVGS